MAIYHLNHRSVGKKTHAPGTAAAAVRYITRAAACQRIDAVGGVSTHPKALEREAVRQEEASRKNARVCDKFVVSLPAEMSLAERVAVTRAFLVRLTQDGRARAFACYHGQETQNPHVHIMFFDRDSERREAIAPDYGLDAFGRASRSIRRALTGYFVNDDAVESFREPIIVDVRQR